MSNTVIRIENVSKMYRLGEIGTGTLSHDLNRWWAGVRGKEDPYSRIGAVNDRTTKDGGDYVWALRDINLGVEEGKVLGIIGKNGAGKSTLLKILSRVTSPSTGLIKIKGRVASLLEVGTGFHPEMTGRENIYMNGTIMGMRKWEITSKLDEIVDFAGVAKYLDTPIKRYSSGMMVRLGFAVAAFLEPEILIVDEVLAVGDAEFQKRAIGKMQDVSMKQGRTILFVSHNMGSVKMICDQAVIVNNGYLGEVNEPDIVIDEYLSMTGIDNLARGKWINDNTTESLKVILNSVEVLGRDAQPKEVIGVDEEIRIRISFEILEKLKEFRIVLTLQNSKGIAAFTAFEDDSVHNNFERQKGSHVVDLIVPGNFLNIDSYTILLGMNQPKIEYLIAVEPRLTFNIVETSNYALYPKGLEGVVRPQLNWNYINEIRG